MSGFLGSAWLWIRPQGCTYPCFTLPPFIFLLSSVSLYKYTAIFNPGNRIKTLRPASWEAGNTICSCAGVGAFALGSSTVVSRGVPRVVWSYWYCGCGPAQMVSGRGGLLSLPLTQSHGPSDHLILASRLSIFWCSPDFDTVRWEIPDLDTKSAESVSSPRCTPCPLVTLPLFQAASVAAGRGPYCDGLVGRLLMFLAAA